MVFWCCFVDFCRQIFFLRDINKMASNIKQPPKLKIQQQDIDPWKAEQSKELNGMQYSSFATYQSINRHTISFNPQQQNHKEIKEQKTSKMRNNFVDNLRKYQKKKAQDIKFKRQINFIQKNRKQVQDPLLCPNQEREMMTSHLFVNQKLKKEQESYYQTTIEPVNWSLIMYYENDRNKKKLRHNQIQAFLKHHSLKIDKMKKKQFSQQNCFVNNQPVSKGDTDSFQKMLKIREGIRRRNLKSASTSRHHLDTDENDTKLRSTLQHQSKLAGSKLVQRRSVPKTSSSSRPKRTLECRIQVVGKTNSIVAAKKEKMSDLRTIHSSQKGRAQRKVLNIQGGKGFSK